MANLIGYLHYGHHAGVVHRLGHRQISSKLATWHGTVKTYLDKDGSYTVEVNGKVVSEGNVNKK